MYLHLQGAQMVDIRDQRSKERDPNKKTYNFPNGESVGICPKCGEWFKSGTAVLRDENGVVYHAFCLPVTKK